MNRVPTIPNITYQENCNPYLMHINFYCINQNKCISYFIRNNCLIRFFPEIMGKLWPKLFCIGSKVQKIIFKHKYRHSFNLPLYDNTFTSIYYGLHKKQFLSIDYYRPILEFNNNKDKNEIDTSSSYIIECNVDDLDRFKKIWCSDDIEYDCKGDIDACNVLNRISFLLLKHNDEKLNELIRIATDSNYGIINLIDDSFHLFNQHKFVSDKQSYLKIKQYFRKKMVIECSAKFDEECFSMKRHCRKEQEKNNNKDRNISLSLYNDKDLLSTTWNTLLDKIHCPLFHGLSTNFRRKYQRNTLNNDPTFFEKSSDRKNILNRISSEKLLTKESYTEFPLLEFGVSIDEWFDGDIIPKLTYRVEWG